MDVRIKCYNQGTTPYDEAGNLITGIPVDDGSVAVRLVGGAYEGNAEHVPNPPNAVPNGTDVARNWKTGFPFSAAMQNYSATEINNTTGQFLYTGVRTLPIVGGVEVKHQIAAVTAAGVPGPAVSVQGTAAEGGRGMFDPDTGSVGCGIQEENDSYSSPRADVAADSIWDESATGMFCKEPELAAMGDGGLPLGSGEWDNARVQFRKYEFESTPGGLHPVAHGLQRGRPQQRRGHLARGQLQRRRHQDPERLVERREQHVPQQPRHGLQRQDLPVRGRRHLVRRERPGTARVGPAQALVDVRQPKANWVFGRQLNWAGARPSLTQFPEKTATSAACDRKAPTVDASSGVNITLSSRTGWHHQAGRLVVCGPIVQGGTHTTAIGQRPATSLGARLLPTAITLNGWGPGGSTAAKLQFADRDPIRITQSMTGGNTTCWDSGTCALTQPVFRASQFGNGAPNGAWPGAGTLSSLFVDVTGDAEFANQANAFIQFKLTLSGGAGNCTVKFGPNTADRLPDNYAVTSYDLLDPAADGNCDTLIGGGTIDRNKLLDSYVDVTVALAPPKERNTAWGWFNWLCQGLKAIGNWTGWWNLGCDNRPTSISYAFD